AGRARPPPTGGGMTERGASEGAPMRAPDELVALAGLPGMGPARLHALLSAFDATEAWARVSRGDVDAPEHVRSMWRAAAARVDVGAVAAAHRDAGVTVLGADDPAFPSQLRDDLEPPAVLFVRGSLDALADR